MLIERNQMTKLSNEVEHEALRLSQAGLTHREVGRLIGISKSPVGNVIVRDAARRFAPKPWNPSPTRLSMTDREEIRVSLDRNGALWNEARTVLEQELREPKVYFTLLTQLASGDKELGEITSRARLSPSQASKYLSVLENMRIVRRRLPVLATKETRGGQWHLDDSFFRFWFRFVFPYQDDLENGLRAADLFSGEVKPALADHVAPMFEDWARDWVRGRFGSRASSVGAWWGPSLHNLRRTGERSTEEIDVVGVGRGKVTVVGEAKWQERMLGASILADLRDHKLPALAQAGFKFANDVDVVLLAKSGYTEDLKEVESADPHLHLVDVAADLVGGPTEE